MDPITRALKWLECGCSKCKLISFSLPTMFISVFEITRIAITFIYEYLFLCTRTYACLSFTNIYQLYFTI